MTGRDNNINPGNDFLDKVLGRTSGSACSRACQQLPDLVDAQLEGIDRQLVQAHLEHCSDCRKIAVVMGWVGGQLNQMAELDPGPSFLSGVLERTTGRVDRPEVVGEHLVPGSSKLLDSLRRWWDKSLLRPNFAMEVAYVATVLMIMMATIPSSPLKGTGGKAIDMLQAGSPPLAFAETVFDEGIDFLEHKFTTSTGRFGARVDDGQGKIRLNLTDRMERTAVSRAAVLDGFKAVLPLIREGHYGEAGSQTVQTLRAVGLTWQCWWIEEERSAPGRQAG